MLKTEDSRKLLRIAAASYIIQPAKAAYGNDVIAANGQTGAWGDQFSSAATDGSGFGIVDFRANGCKSILSSN